MPITTAGTAWFLTKIDTDPATDVWDAEVHVLTDVLEQLPGVRRATVRTCDSPAHRKVFIEGTDRGKRLALDVAKVAKVYEPDHNADHDHAACVRSAADQGVPEAYAHNPETYLSM